MDRVAEYGIAAHALYKDGELGGRNIAKLDEEDCRAYEWLRRTIEMLSQGDTPEEFLENTKLELFHDQVFCFTPKGTPDRPAARRDADRLCLCGSYRHRQHLRRRQDQRPDHAAGDRAANGDEVEIVRSQAQTPPPAWENIAITGKARAAIRRATRESDVRSFAPGIR
jgi:guanosine-3',5'-bis(diphosphate) 3'-pyrophosphohydrolase